MTISPYRNAGLPAAPKLGVIINAQSGRNRGGTRELDSLLARHPEIVVARPSAPHETAAALASLAREKVNVLGICGGDGTVQQVLNVILDERSPFAELPPLVILPGGTTNMIAHDINTSRRPVAVLQGVLDRLATPPPDMELATRPVMRLTGGSATSPAFGMFFGAAGIYEATLQNRGSIDAVGLRDGFGPGLRLLAVLFKIATGRDPFVPVPIRLTFDGNPCGPRACVAILATTMKVLSLGMVPFWGDGVGAIRLTLAMAGSRSILRAIWLALKSRPHPLLVPENGYESVNADRIELAFEGDCVLDGETFTASPDRPILLENAGNLRFLAG